MTRTSASIVPSSLGWAFSGVEADSCPEARGGWRARVGVHWTGMTRRSATSEIERALRQRGKPVEGVRHAEPVAIDAFPRAPELDRAPGLAPRARPPANKASATPSTMSGDRQSSASVAGLFAGADAPAPSNRSMPAASIADRTDASMPPFAASSNAQPGRQPVALLHQGPVGPGPDRDTVPAARSANMATKPRSELGAAAWKKRRAGPRFESSSLRRRCVPHRHKQGQAPPRPPRRPERFPRRSTGRRPVRRSRPPGRPKRPAGGRACSGATSRTCARAPRRTRRPPGRGRPTVAPWSAACGTRAGRWSRRCCRRRISARSSRRAPRCASPRSPEPR